MSESQKGDVEIKSAKTKKDIPYTCCSNGILEQAEK